MEKLLGPEPSTLADTSPGTTAGLTATEGVAGSWYDSDNDQAVIRLHN